MMDFIYELYKNDHFTMYLTIALVILIILFVVVLFFGKKDQKLEETRRLQKIELENTFKEEPTPATPVEVTKSAIEENLGPVKEDIPLPDTNVMTSINTIEKPQTIDETVHVTDITPKVPVVEENETLDIPTIAVTNNHKDNEEESKPITLEELKNAPLIEDDEDINIDLSSLDKIKNEFDQIELPKIKDEVTEEPKEEKVFKPSQVFSSVYVNKKDEINTHNEEEKTTVVSEPAVNVNSNSKLFTIEDDDDEDMELPSLKKEEPPTAILNEVEGDTYHLKF